MKVGSLVILMVDFNVIIKRAAGTYGLILPVPEQIYTVRARATCKRCNALYIQLDEIVNPLMQPENDEIGFEAYRFKEIQPPVDIVALIGLPGVLFANFAAKK